MCDIDRVLFRVAQSRVRKYGRPCTTEIYRLGLLNFPGCPKFQTGDSETLNDTLSISHNPRPLAAGPIRNTENMEYLLGMFQQYQVL